MLESEFYILGYSGHSFVVLESAIQSGMTCLGYFEKEEKLKNPFSLKYLGSETDFKDWNEVNVFAAFGDNQMRLRLISNLQNRGVRGVNIIDQSASLSVFASIGQFNFVSKGSVVQTFVKIGNGCIINSGAIVEHECVIMDGVHVSPGAVLCGGVIVGSGSWIGAGAVIREGVQVGKNVIVGAGSVVLKDIPDGDTCWGAPAVSRV